MSSENHDQQDRSIHFFKVILERTLQQGELKIPRSFVKQYGDKLWNPVNLVLPNGDKYEVQWIKRDNDILFQKGWKKIAHNYSLREGHFLVFKYEGGSQFKVMIFNESALEINYPTIIIGTSTDDAEHDAEKSDGDDSASLPPHKSIKTNTGDMRGGSMNVNNWSKSETNNRRKNESHKEIRGSKALEIRGSKALERARRFRTNHPSFIRTLHPSYLQNLLVIPTSFSKIHVNALEGSASIVVSEDMEKTWDVKLKFKKCSNRTIITTGWGRIAQEYNLKEGQVCVFELTHTHDTKFSFKVTIFRDTDPPSSQNQFQDCGGPSMRREE